MRLAERRAHELGHAAGYAEAVGDVVALVEDYERDGVIPVVLSNLIKRGAHVGAAKKGGGT